MAVDGRENPFDLTGRTALVTGGAGLLGARHAEALLHAGASVVLADLDPARLERVASELESRVGRRPSVVVMDVTDESSVREVARRHNTAPARVDVLVNNAARNPAVKADGAVANSNRLEQLDLATYGLDVAVGLTGAVLCAKHFGAAMAERGDGVIINVASDLGVIAPDQRLYRKEGVPDDQQDVKPVSYSVVKHGLVGLTKYLATYWADRGVRCNALSPGGVEAGQGEVFLRRIAPLIPLGRMARPDEYQGAIVFLASRASSYMTGANLIVDGGRSVW
jgi:NAD(P)-dependent dehydrogenase (short-subunit alcohol dehydrogenase family)